MAIFCMVAVFVGSEPSAFPQGLTGSEVFAKTGKTILPGQMTIVSSPKGGWPNLERRLANELRLLGWDVQVTTQAEADLKRTNAAESKGKVRARLWLKPVSSSTSVRVVLSARGADGVEFDLVLPGPVTGKDASPDLAIQIAELVRAKVGEAEARRVLASTRAQAPNQRQPGPSRWELGASVMALGLIGSVGPAVGPEIQARLRLSDAWFVGVTGFLDLAGPSLQVSDGSAAIHAYSLLGHVWWSPFGQGSVRGALGVGGGVLILGVRSLSDQFAPTEDLAQAGLLDVRARIDWSPFGGTSLGPPSFFTWVGGSAIVPRIEVELDATRTDPLEVVALSSGLGVSFAF